MATPSEKLADALEKMHAVQVDGIVQSSRLSRTVFERLVAAGFLQEILRGWYYVTNPTAAPDAAVGTTVWYGHFWDFVRQYLAERLGEDYCLLPEPSLLLLTGATAVPRQLAVMRRTPGQQVVKLCLDTSLLLYQDKTNFPDETVEVNGVRVMQLHEALVRAPEGFFRGRTAGDATIALRLLRDAAPLLRTLLEGGHSVIAGRLAGAFRHVGRGAVADRIVRTMKSAGYDVREHDPFDAPAAAPALLAAGRPRSAHVARVQEMWAAMRADVEATFPAAPGLPADAGGYLAAIEEKYVQDAYNSLSIEGYRVTPELVEKVRSGAWDPMGDPRDRGASDALAARGYLEAFRAVKASVGRVLAGEAAASVVRDDHHDWYQALFAPAVQAGLVAPTALAGYRGGQVYIRGSRHVPPPAHAVTDAMETLFDLLEAEESPAVRAVLGHFLFVYIHPYSDGNGRVGRFLMNALLASGGFPWTIVRLENRGRYMGALEEASVHGDVRPLAAYLREELEQPSVA